MTAMAFGLWLSSFLLAAQQQSLVIELVENNIYELQLWVSRQFSFFHIDSSARAINNETFQDGQVCNSIILHSDTSYGEEK